MTDIELELTKLRWRMAIGESLLAKVVALPFVSTGTPQHEFDQAIEKVFAGIQQAGVAGLREESNADLLTEEFVKVVEEVKSSFTSVRMPEKSGETNPE